MRNQIFFFIVSLLLVLGPTGGWSLEPSIEIREVNGVPFLWENGLPYFTRFQETDHEILDLAGPWKFSLDENADGIESGWFREEMDDSGWRDHPVPGSWQAVFPELREYIGIGWYRRRFFVPASWEGKFNRLVLDAAGFHTRVWINGREAGQHAGNYSRWSLDVSSLLRYGGENVIAVQVDNILSYSDVPPRIWRGSRLGWWEYAGLQRLVQLESSPLLTAAKLAVIAEPGLPGAGTLDVTGLVFNAGPAAAKMEVSCCLSDLAGQLLLEFPAERGEVPGRGVAVFRFSGEVPGIALWSPETPGNRYRLTLIVSSQSGREEQSVEIGFRRFEVCGTQVCLNGKPYYLRGINRHEDDPDTGLYQSESRLEEDLALLRELRVNHLRGAHYPNDPRWLDGLDREGFTFCEEIPLYQAGMGFTKFFEVLFLGAEVEEETPPGVEERSFVELLHQQSDPVLIENAIHQMIETIERDRNHPSVVMWSVGNENMTLRLFPSSRAMHQRVIEAVRRFDPSRPVTFAIITSADFSPALEGVADLADVISVNEYYGWYYGRMEEAGPYFDRLHRKWPDKPILISEFGADAIPGKHAEPGKPPPKFTEEYQVKMVEHVWAEIRRRPEFIVGGMPWCFADFRVGWFGDMHPTRHMNEKGVLTYRREKKLGFEALRRIYVEIERAGP